MGTSEDEKLGYSKKALDDWAARIGTWAEGESPAGLETVTEQKPEKAGRDVYFYVISGFKERNPQAAMALIERV
jgi:uncharacterized protein YecE (DUF72 family)